MIDNDSRNSARDKWPTSEDVKAICSAKDVAEARRAKAELIVRKKEIEAQLGSDKLEMLQDREAFLKKGMPLREAQMRATNSGDLDWRAAASHAARMVDRDITKLNTIISTYSNPSAPSAGNLQAPPIIKVFRGTPEEVAAAISSEGLKIVTMVSYKDAMVVAFWGH